jgi:hypothetical protein
MKSVPNLISYLHEFFQNFSQSPAIYFELISFGVIFNSEITDERRSPNRLASLVLTAPSPGPKPTIAVRAPRPSLPGRLRRCEHDHGERRPSSPLTVLCPWSVELTQWRALPDGYQPTALLL